jgi:hypothetical protein
MIVDPVTMKLLADEHVKEMQRMAQHGKGEPSQTKRASIRLGLLTLVLLAFILV